MHYLACLSLLFVCLVRAGTVPLTVSEISLMLRAGYSPSAVETELASRRFADTLDETKRQALIKAGATPQLLQALATGKYAAPKEEIDKARRQREEQNQQRALAAAREKKLDAFTPTHSDKQGAAGTAGPAPDTIAEMLKGNLVRCQNGLLTSYYDEELNRKKSTDFTSPPSGVRRVVSLLRNWSIIITAYRGTIPSSRLSSSARTNPPMP